MNKSKQMRGFPFEARLPKESVARAEALRVFAELREQAKDSPEMLLENLADVHRSEFSFVLQEK